MGSANGRQTGSEPVNLGSTPSPTADSTRHARSRLAATILVKGFHNLAGRQESS